MIILEALFFAIPMYTSNSFASLSMSIPILRDWTTPIDFGKSWNGKRIFGRGKTFRGLLLGSLFGVIAGVIQYYISSKLKFEYLAAYNEKSLNFFILQGFLLGFGALTGDAIKSFFKRRIGIKQGRPWPPFDQLDFIIGGFIFAYPLFFPGWKIMLTLVIITPVLHLLTNIAAYKLKLKDVWW